MTTHGLKMQPESNSPTCIHRLCRVALLPYCVADELADETSTISSNDDDILLYLKLTVGSTAGLSRSHESERDFPIRKGVVSN